MRKRRRLANKMTIMVYAVLIAVSTFFYAPMEAEAKSGVVNIGVQEVNVGESRYFFSSSIAHIGDYEFYPNSTERLDVDSIVYNVSDFYHSNEVNYSVPLGSWSNYSSDLILDPGYDVVCVQFPLRLRPFVNLDNSFSGYGTSTSRIEISKVIVSMWGQDFIVPFSLLPNESGGYDCWSWVSCYFKKPADYIALADSQLNICVEYNLSARVYCTASNSAIYTEEAKPFVKMFIGDSNGTFYYDDLKSTEINALENSNSGTVEAIENQTDVLEDVTQSQTDSLTNGFDNSQGDVVNSDLSAGLNEYQTAEDSLFATATTGMNDFTFFDIESVPAMVTGISFITATMTSWFNQAGGVSGVGIVLSILFSVMLVAMVLGLYRWYQSRGGKD